VTTGDVEIGSTNKKPATLPWRVSNLRSQAGQASG